MRRQKKELNCRHSRWPAARDAEVKELKKQEVELYLQTGVCHKRVKYDLSHYRCYPLPKPDMSIAEANDLREHSKNI